ncbi:MAG: nucleotide sugar dehydrogenase [Myxococcales bacterium]|nr:nucleotide sugar dehydrogenase [Myxococcales bacterium]
MNWNEKIQRKDVHVVVIGIGYVGLPLVVEFARAGFRVTGYDLDKRKVDKLAVGESYIEDISSESLRPHVAEGRLKATTNESVLATADAIIVCVPTPLNKTKEPDVSFIVSATEAIARHYKPGQCVVLESTTYPGTTRELVAPMLEKAGAKIGETLFLAFSPERVDPANKVYGTRNTPKVLGGATPNCLEVSVALYSKIIDKVVPVSSTDAAEMVKLLENTFRAVNIGLVNEVAIMCHKLGLDVWEIIDAAATKPFGFMKFTPGPGLGGHCIPIDPLYLSWKLRALKYTAEFIELADDINSAMPSYCVTRIADLLNDKGKAIKGSKVLIVGVAYKRDVSDMRESPAIDVVELLHKKGADISFVDPYVPVFEEGTMRLESLPIDTDASKFDIAVIVTDHTEFDYAKLVKTAPIIFDTRNATRVVGGSKDNVYLL